MCEERNRKRGKNITKQDRKKERRIKEKERKQ